MSDLISKVLSGESQWCVVHGDNRDILPTIPDRGVDHVITDPPYSAEVHSRAIRMTSLPNIAGQPCRRIRAHDFGFDCITPEIQVQCAMEFSRLCRRWCLVFSDTETAALWRTQLIKAKLQFIRYGFWVKDRAMPQISGDRPGSRVEQIIIAHPKGRKRWNGGGCGNVWQHGDRSERLHTTQKPLSLMLELIELFTSRSDVILDPFCGSATTLIAALRLGRRAIGIERNAKWAEISRERCQAEIEDSTFQARRNRQLPLLATLKPASTSRPAAGSPAITLESAGLAAERGAP